MINLFSLLSSYSKFNSEIPPIYISYIPAHGIPLPSEISKDNFSPEAHGISISYLMIENFSNCVLTNVRIKLNYHFEYKPLVESNNFNMTPSYKYDEKISEIQIDKLDPSEKLNCTFFSTLDGPYSLPEPQVIFKDRVITRFMKTRGSLKKYSKTFLSFSIFMSFTLLCCFWILKLNINAMHDNNLISHAMTNFSSGCNVKVIDHEDLKQKPFSAFSPLETEYTKKLNNIQEITDLLQLDKMVACIED